MAEPVSRQAWARLVTLLNVYVRDGRNLYGTQAVRRIGGFWSDSTAEIETDESWNLPDTITRSLVRAAFGDIDYLQSYDQLFYVASIFSTGNDIAEIDSLTMFYREYQSDISSLFKELRDNLNLGNEYGFRFLNDSHFAKLGIGVSTGLLSFLSTEPDKQASVDRFTIWWLNNLGQEVDFSGGRLSWSSYRSYVNFCQLAIQQFENSGHLPDGCNDPDFVHFLIQCDVQSTLRQTRWSTWADSSDQLIDES